MVKQKNDKKETALIFLCPMYEVHMNMSFIVLALF
jgi:hypothetical protein